MQFLQEKVKLIKKEDPVMLKSPEDFPVYWFETSDSVSHRYQFQSDGHLSMKVVDDARPVPQKMVESFLNKFFPSGYPYSVNEGYLRYTQFRALQHFSSAALSVLSTQSLLFAAGLRPTPAQATVVSWILKDGMQHVGKLICSNLGARMDSEPKRWRILADVLYDLGTGLELVSPLCPHLFLEMAGLGNFAKGMATVAARATRLPIYSSFAKEGNLSDIFAKGEAISTLFNVAGIGAGIQLASTICSSMEGKLVVGSILSVVHVYSVVEQMRGVPINTLNPQRTALIVANFLKTGKVPSPPDLRFQKILPASVKVHLKETRLQLKRQQKRRNVLSQKRLQKKGRAGRKKSVPPPAHASEIQLWQPTPPKTPLSRSKPKGKGRKSIQDSGKARGPSGELLCQDSIAEIIYRMQNLYLGDKEREQEQNAMVLYKGDGALVPYESKKRKPRPKVDIDDETTRIWNLLMGKGDEKEGDEEKDKKKEKWWEEERRVFRGRADSFIARMHLVQGDRRFSPWKGSVVDSVIGVFLTQNVSDHLSSSAFMSLAARFPPKLSSSREDERNVRSVVVEDPEGCILNLNEIPSWQEKVQHPSDMEVSGVDSGSKEQLRDCSNSGIERFNFLEKSIQNLEEEVLSSQDSFDPAIFQSCGRVGSCSCSKSDAEFPTTRCETKTVSGTSQSVQTGSPNLSDEICLQGNERPHLYEGSGDVQKQETTNVAQKKPDLEKTMNWKDSVCFGQPRNDTNWQTTPSSSYEQCATRQPHVLDIEDFGMQGEGLGYSWMSISPRVDRVKNKNVPRRFFRQGGSVPREFTGQIIPSTPHELPGMGLSGSSSAVQEHQDDTQHNQQDEMNKASHLQKTFLDLLNSSEECLTRQSSTKQNITDGCLPRDRTAEDVVDPLSNNSSLQNILVESNSSNKEQTAVEYKETNATILREMKGTLADGKKPTSQWDSLRKDVEGNEGRQERNKNNMDSIDYEAIRRASISEISEAIKERGMNNMLAVRIKDFLERIVKDHGGIDLEWLRESPPDKAKDYLLSIRGLGLKSVECVRLLTLHNLAFPVDTNVGRIAVRMGWVPLQPLPESLQLHLLELYPVLESIQKFLWPRLCKLDQRTLYELHYQLITFGKVFCTKSRPNCNACPMRGECRHFASAYASARLALPAPEERSLTSATIPVPPESYPPVAIPMIELPLPLEKSLASGAPSNRENCEPIIEEPASPGQECTEITESDIEDAYYNEDPDEIPTIKLNIEQFGMTLREHMERNMELQEGDMSKALVALHPTTTSIPTPKLKNISRLRTEHQVYELPDSHRLLDGMDKREPDDPSPYLLAIWTPGETANSAQPPEQKCGGKASGKMCFDETCSECNSLREANSQTVRGTLLIPCRTAMRGSFPLNGTYFQVNELFADHESSLKPIDVPRDWIWDLPRRTVYFGTSVTSIFRGLSTEQIQFCFWKGFVCVRGFEQKTRAPRPLMARLHFPASKLKNNKT